MPGDAFDGFSAPGAVVVEILCQILFSDETGHRRFPVESESETAEEADLFTFKDFGEDIAPPEDMSVRSGDISLRQREERAVAVAAIVIELEGPVGVSHVVCVFRHPFCLFTPEFESHVCFQTVHVEPHAVHGDILVPDAEGTVSGTFVLFRQEVILCFVDTDPGERRAFFGGPLLVIFADQCDVFRAGQPEEPPFP